MYRSPGQRPLGEVFEEALWEQSEARVGGIPKGTRKLADVFEEAKREGEEARARQTIRRKRTYGQRDVEFSEAERQSSGGAVDVFEGMDERNRQKTLRVGLFEGMDERNRQNMLRVGLGIRISAEIFEASEREYRERGEERLRKRRARIGRGAKEVETSEPRHERSESRERRELASVVGRLEDEFAEKERLSQEQLWCTRIPHDTKVSTVEQFYTAFHDMSTLLVNICMVCYRKFGRSELEEIDWRRRMRSCPGQRYSQFNCQRCFPVGKKVLGCRGCMKDWERGVLSPAASLHSQLGCEHAFPDELKGLTPVEEKLIALNTCYGFITKYTVPGGG